MTTGAYISIITLSINGLNVPTERHKPAERTFKIKKGQI